MTDYVVLQLQEGEIGDSHIWRVVGRGTARSSVSAIREALDAEEGPAQGQFVAVPARSWKPVTVKVETKTALKFS